MTMKDIKKLVQKADIILSLNRENLLSQTIAAVTESPWSHVFIYIGMGNIIESTIGGVQISRLNKYLNPDVYNICLMRHKDITPRLQKQIVKDAMKYVGYRYGYIQLLWYLFLRLIQKSEDPLWQLDLDDGAMVCSEAIARAYADAGLEIKPEFKPAGMEPADFYESDMLIKIAEVIK